MTCKDFIKYLAAKLLRSGEDCCSVCAYSPADDVCDNYKAHPDGKLDDEICIAGLRAFAESKEKKAEPIEIDIFKEVQSIIQKLLDILESLKRLSDMEEADYMSEILEDAEDQISYVIDSFDGMPLPF